MTTQEKWIIESILAGIGLEPLHIGANKLEPKDKPVTIVMSSR